MKTLLIAAALAAPLSGLASAGLAAPETYNLDASHSQVVFRYNHLGFSTSYGMFSGFEGEIIFDAEDPAASSVTVSMPVTSMLTGWQARFDHFMSAEFFNASENADVSFASTSIAVTGEASADITGDLTMNGVTRSVTLDATLNQAGDNPMSGTAWLGFDASVTLLRSDYGLELFAPFVSDEVEVMISVEAGRAE